MVVNANTTTYDTIFSNLVEKSSKFWPLKPHVLMSHGSKAFVPNVNLN
jgi:hypothetical protein